MIVSAVVSSDDQLPTYSHDGDAGADLRCVEDFTLEPGQRAVVGTGVRLALPPGHVGMVCPRSGLAARHGLSIVNGPGIVDSGYRGEIKVCLVNLDPSEAVSFSAGDRIAQLVIVPFVTASFDVVTDLDETARGTGGYGSTNISASGGPQK